jgi:hypothetical protein
MKHKLLVLFATASLMLATNHVFSRQVYVSTTGSDTNSGSESAPYLSLFWAVANCLSGDTIHVASGVYTKSYNGIETTAYPITVSKSRVTILGEFSSVAERPVIDFSKMPVSSNQFGLRLTKDSCYVYGIIIKGAGDNGMLIDGGKYNTVEFCDFLENRDTGLQLKANAQHNRIINCDSYFNVDPAQGNADGFANKLDVGGNNLFKGCRAWQNSDDGWDGLLGDVNYSPSDSIVESWCYKNGYLKNGNASTGNGNGFKLGGTQAGATGPFKHRNKLVKCLSALNRSKGFDFNNNVGSSELYNCTGYGNLNSGGNYVFGAVATGETLVFKNCVAHAGTRFGSINSAAVQVTNSWLTGYTVSDDDFVSLDHTQMLAPRKADGSLPDITFMHLKEGSDLVDTGTDIGLPFKGTLPDLGCFESDFTVSVTDGVVSEASFTIYPNPSQGVFRLKSANLGNGTVKVFNQMGNLVMEKTMSAGVLEQEIVLSGHAPGVYMIHITSGSQTVGRSVIVQK